MGLSWKCECGHPAYNHFIVTQISTNEKTRGVWIFIPAAELRILWAEPDRVAPAGIHTMPDSRM